MKDAVKISKISISHLSCLCVPSGYSEQEVCVHSVICGKISYVILTFHKGFESIKIVNICHQNCQYLPSSPIIPIAHPLPICKIHVWSCLWSNAILLRRWDVEKGVIYVLHIICHMIGKVLNQNVVDQTAFAHCSTNISHMRILLT